MEAKIDKGASRCKFTKVGASPEQEEREALSGFSPVTHSTVLSIVSRSYNIKTGQVSVHLIYTNIKAKILFNTNCCSPAMFLLCSGDSCESWNLAVVLVM